MAKSAIFVDCNGGSALNTYIANNLIEAVGWINNPLGLLKSQSQF